MGARPRFPLFERISRGLFTGTLGDPRSVTGCPYGPLSVPEISDAATAAPDFANASSASGSCSIRYVKGAEEGTVFIDNGGTGRVQ